MLSNYFFEIRNRIVLVIFSWSVTVLFAYLNKETLLFLSIKPNIKLFKETTFYFIATNVTDVFSVYVSLIYLVSFQLTLIYCFYNFYKFIESALYKKESQNLLFFFKTGFTLWIFSLLLLNKLVLPLCWEFFSSFQNSSSQSINIFLEIRITEYLAFYIMTYYITAFITQCFTLIFLCLGLLKKKLLFIRATRKIFYLIFLGLATVVTPPDVVSQLLLGTIFVLVYELIIVIIITKDFNLIR